MESRSVNHWVVRVNDGFNLINSKYNVFGLVRNHLGMVKKMKFGDKIWFLTNKENGGKIIRVVDFDYYYDRKNEPFWNVHTYKNEEIGWKEDTEWDIQIHYNNIYEIESLDICGIFRGAAVVYSWDTVKTHFNKNIKDEYELIVKYSGCIKKNN